MSNGNDLYDNWDLESYNQAYNTPNNDRFPNEGNLYKQFDRDMNYRGPDPFGRFRSGIGSFYNDPGFQHEGSLQGPAVYPGADRNIHEGFGTADVSSTFPPPEKKGMFTGFASALLKKLPRQDSRQVALTDFYGGKGNLQGGQTIKSGLMAGYNPVSGGFLNKATFGKFGQPTNYGLQGAYDKRIGTIDKTLAKWEADEDKYAERLKTTQLYARRKQLQEDKAAELAMLNKVPTTGEGGPVITDGGKAGDGAGGAVDQGSGYSTQGGFTGDADPTSGGVRGHHGDWAQGGRVGYQGGELVDEDINVQGPGFDVNENMEMSEGPSAFEMRIQELVDEGLSWQEAYQIAAQEFGMAEGQQDSFSEEGIASLV